MKPTGRNDVCNRPAISRRAFGASLHAIPDCRQLFHPRKIESEYDPCAAFSFECVDISRPCQLRHLEKIDENELEEYGTPLSKEGRLQLASPVTRFPVNKDISTLSDTAADHGIDRET
jgi:hypothetical protein